MALPGGVSWGGTPVWDSMMQRYEFFFNKTKESCFFILISFLWPFSPIVFPDCRGHMPASRLRWRLMPMSWSTAEARGVDTGQQAADIVATG